MIVGCFPKPRLDRGHIAAVKPGTPSPDVCAVPSRKVRTVSIHQVSTVAKSLSTL